MGLILIALRWSLLAATAMTGVIGAYHGVPVLFEDYGYGIDNVAAVVGLVTTLVATLLAGAFYLLAARRRMFRIQAGAALLLFGLSLITVHTVGYYFLMSGSLALISLCWIATKRPADRGEPYAWMGAIVRVRSKRRAA